MECSLDRVDTCVIGGGVVGLAVGRALANAGREVIVLERESQYGQGVSSRNSEVIHAGIYYPAGSLKAQLCVEGKMRLYEYCESRGISHARCGKLIVATQPEEEPVLQDILDKASANGVDDLQWWSADQLARAEPSVRATLALYSPSTGIISSHELMRALLADIEQAGGILAEHTCVMSVTRRDGQFIVMCTSGEDEYRFACRNLVNAAGLGAQAVAAGFDFLDPQTIPPRYLCKGNYFMLSGKNPFSHLIYPVPEPSGAGLGVHATIDLGGQARFGPDVEYIDEEDYVVSTRREADYYTAVRRYFPSLADGQLVPGYVGIRPKLQGPGDPPADFVIQDASTHDIEGLVQLFGIESPGLTSSMAIADYVARVLSAPA